MEELQARHRKEQRDLQARITQKKKAATKKTRKGVNDECANLERELKERQEQEVSALLGDRAGSAPTGIPGEDGPKSGLVRDTAADSNVQASLEYLTVSTEDANSVASEGKNKKPNRQKARLARRAAEQAALAEEAAAEAASMPDLKARESEQMHSHFSKHGLQEKEIRADGHCLYSAIADQLETRGLGLKPKISTTVLSEGAQSDGTIPDYKLVRNVAADYIAANSDDFVPFLEEPVDVYTDKIRNTGEWGGHVELLALARTYGVHINVLHADGRIDRIEPGNQGYDKDKAVWLGYYRHASGLGEHYNSLRKVA